jgi:hypothetical protein
VDQWQMFTLTRAYRRQASSHSRSLLPAEALWALIIPVAAMTRPPANPVYRHAAATQTAAAYSHHQVVRQRAYHGQVMADQQHGFKHSAALGEAFAQWCIRRASDLVLSSFSLKRFANS